MDVLIGYVTVPDVETGRRIARQIVEEHLAACCNIVPSVESIYRWEGNVEAARECLMIVKTTAGRFNAMRDRIVELHPYDVPEVIASPASHGLEAYLEWVKGSVGS